MNKFIRKPDSFFNNNEIIDTFVFNREKFDVIVIHWSFYLKNDKRRKEAENIFGHGMNNWNIFGHGMNNWNIYIRFKPDFPGFDELPSDYNEFDLINFSGGATFFKMDGKNKVYGNDYMHFGDEDVMNCEKFNNSNRCFIDAHKIIEKLEAIIKEAYYGKN